MQPLFLPPETITFPVSFFPATSPCSLFSFRPLQGDHWLSIVTPAFKPVSTPFRFLQRRKGTGSAHSSTPSWPVSYRAPCPVSRFAQEVAWRPPPPPDKSPVHMLQCWPKFLFPPFSAGWWPRSVSHLRPAFQERLQWLARMSFGDLVIPPVHWERQRKRNGFFLCLYWALRIRDRGSR